jgi:TolB-like protein/Flp pilus assembly protein TadD
MIELQRRSLKVKFGTFEVDIQTREVRKHGMHVRLEEKPFRILELLLDRPGKVVTRRALRDSLWPDTHVGYEHSLNTAVNKLRELLGDSAQSPRFVQTIPRRGYRFIAPVQTVGNRRTHNDKHMLVVLPFENLSGSPDQDYFADGLTEELIAQLGQLNPARLGVIARTSAFLYKRANKPLSEIGRELGVDCVMEGSVRRVGKRVRITVQLIETERQTQLWANSYDYKVADILGMQQDLALQVGAALKLELLPGSSSASIELNPAAHQAYLLGRFFCGQRSESSLQKAIGMFEEALAIEPNCAHSLSSIADCSMLLCWFGALLPRIAGARGGSAARRAIDIDPQMSEAHASLALVKFWYEWDWNAAESEFQQAIDLNPSYAMAHLWYASFLNSMGRREEARVEQRAAQELDPLSPMIHMNLADVDYFARDYDRAIAHLRSLLDSAPRYLPALFNLGRSYLQKGMYRNAVMAFEQIFELSGNRGCLPALGQAYAHAGRPNDARRILRELTNDSSERYIPATCMAWTHLGLGETDAALEWLERGIEERCFWSVFLKTDPVYDILQSDKRFAGLLQCAGLSDVMASLTPNSHRHGPGISALDESRGVLVTPINPRI